MTEPPLIPIVPGTRPIAEPAAPTPVPPPRRPGWVIPVITGLAVLVLAAGGGVAYLVATRPGGQPAVAATTQPPPPVTREAEQPKQVWPTPKPADFVLTVKTLKKTCFGSAGCNLTYQIDVTYNGLPLEPGSTWDVTYDVRGGNEPQVNTLEVEVSGTDYTARVDREELIQTPSSKSVLTAVATSVSRH